MQGVIDMRKMSDAKYEANRRYDNKTYQRLSLYLRIEDDSDILEDLELAKQNGISYRDWIRTLFDAYKNQ